MVQRHKEGDPGGSLVVVSSVAGIRPPQQAEAYAASKAGVIALTKSVASEFGRFGIRANAILPGFVRSDLSAHLQEMDRFTASVINQRVSMGRWGLPEDFAGIAVYLASDLSKFHTADAIVIDGGYSNS
jgi:NAD(P)-dependent dehydrogenase (short-subunit alcohol dehydrogenase family)